MEDHSQTRHLLEQLCASHGLAGGSPAHRPPCSVLACLERLGLPETFGHVRGGAHRAGNQDRFSDPGAHGALAVDDAVLPEVVLPGGAVVVHVDKACEGTHGRVHPKGDLDLVEHARAIGLREPQRERHRRTVVGVSVRAHRQVRQLGVRQRRVPQRVLAQRPLVERVADRLAQAPRARVQHHEDPANLIALHLEEVVSGAQCAELVHRALPPGVLHRLRQRQPDLGNGYLAVDLEGLARRAGRHAPCDLRQCRVQPLAAQRGYREIRLGKGNATADVNPDRIGHDRAVREQHASDGHAVAGVGVRHERHVVDREGQVGQVRGLLESALIEVGYPALDGHVPGLRDGVADDRGRGHGGWTSGQRSARVRAAWSIGVAGGSRTLVTGSTCRCSTVDLRPPRNRRPALVNRGAGRKRRTSGAALALIGPPSEHGRMVQ